jgi:hypothetical protein
MNLRNLINHMRDYIRFSYEDKPIRNKAVFQLQLTENSFLLLCLDLSLRGFSIFCLHRNLFSQSLPSTYPRIFQLYVQSAHTVFMHKAAPSGNCLFYICADLFGV